MPDPFDVAIVGARCAGAPLATLLARQGARVCLVDRSKFPSEIPSTHAIQPCGVAVLDRLGVTDRIRETGAPPITRASIQIDDVRIDLDDSFGLIEKFGAPMFCVRRVILDQILIDAAVAAGADFRPETAVTGLIETEGVVTGIKTSRGDVAASLVVGADGPSSAVARFAGSREYHATPPGRLFMWAYFEGVRDLEPRIRLGKSGDTAMLSAPTDSQLFLAAVVPSMREKQEYLADTGAGFESGIATFPEVAEITRGGQRVGPVRTMSRWHGYFREATGPGWVLAGDAGHFKDPTPGQGISDALRQVEKLAPAIAEGLDTGTIQARLKQWAAWRDADAWEMYWFATDMGAPGETRPLVREMIRGIVEQPGGTEQFLRVLNHDLAPSKLYTPSRAVKAAARLALGRRDGLRSVGRDLAEIIRQEGVRRSQRRSPVYAAGGGPGAAEAARATL